VDGRRGGERGGHGGTIAPASDSRAATSPLPRVRSTPEQPPLGLAAAGLHLEQVDARLASEALAPTGWQTPESRARARGCSHEPRLRSAARPTRRLASRSRPRRGRCWLGPRRDHGAHGPAAARATLIVHADHHTGGTTHSVRIPDNMERMPGRERPALGRSDRWLSPAPTCAASELRTSPSLEAGPVLLIDIANPRRHHHRLAVASCVGRRAAYVAPPGGQIRSPRSHSSGLPPTDFTRNRSSARPASEALAPTGSPRSIAASTSSARPK
jgi:hypothetical protein